MRMNKKAVSPLIAAVLLIVVTVGIGAVVTGIVRNYVTENKATITEKASDMKCGIEVALNIPVVNEVMKICKTSANTTISFTLENTGSAVVDELQVKAFGASGFNNTDNVFAAQSPVVFASGMPVGATQTLNVTIPAGIGSTLQSVKIVPRVKVVGRSDKAFCSDAALTFSDLSTCT